MDHEFIDKVVFTEEYITPFFTVQKGQVGFVHQYLIPGTGGMFEATKEIAQYAAVELMSRFFPSGTIVNADLKVLEIKGE